MNRVLHSFINHECHVAKSIKKEPHDLLTRKVSIDEPIFVNVTAYY